MYWQRFCPVLSVLAGNFILRKYALLMKHTLLLIPILLLSFCSRPEIQQTPLTTVADSKDISVNYPSNGLAQIQWLSGKWQCADSKTSMLFLFHNSTAVEVIHSENGSNWFTWQDGRIYYGPNRQWVITWIGKKDIRMDAVRPGLPAMTWTRVNEQQWRLIQHTAKGDLITLFERPENTQS